MSIYFSAINRNKRSLTLNLKKQQAKDVLYELVKTADVFIENFVPGKADELGVGYDAISKLNPRIVYASISGYGSSGPYANRAGYDAIAAADDSVGEPQDDLRREELRASLDRAQPGGQAVSPASDRPCRFRSGD